MLQFAAKYDKIKMMCISVNLILRGIVMADFNSGVNTFETVRFEKTVPVVFATNENYAPYAGVAICSMLENSSEKNFYDVYVFHTGLSDKTTENFEKLSRKNCRVTCLDVNSYIDAEIPLYENFHFSKEMYYRILIPTILPQYDKVIYLDSDTVILGDIDELFDTDTEGCAVCGVNDVMHSVSKEYVKNVLGLNPDRYINSGVLIIDCKRFKEYEIKEKCFSVLKSSDIKFRYPDQDIINIVCQDHIKFLDRAWNYIWHYHFPRYNQSPAYLLPDGEKEDYLKAADNIKILHYTSNIKPWNNYCTAFTKIFFDYANKTEPFRDEIYKRYNEIPLKNYVVFQFMDVIGDEVILTGNLCTLEDFLYTDTIFASVNGKKQNVPLSDGRYLDINGLCYAQRFFRLVFSKTDIENGLEITFSKDPDMMTNLNLASGRFFPAHDYLSIPAYFEKYYVRINGTSLLFGKAEKKIKNELKTLKNLLKVKKKSGKKSFVLRIFYFLTKIFFRKEIWLISDRTTSAGDNGEAFFRYLCEKRPKGIKPYFVIEKSSPDFKRLKKIGRVVSPDSIKFYVLYLHCSKNISSQFDEPILSPFYDEFLKDLMIKRKNIFLQHGIIKDDLSRAYNRFNQNMSLFITSARAEYESIVNTPAYFINDYNLALTGLARYDLLENDAKKIIYILPTWRKSITLDLREEDPDKAYESRFYKFYDSLLHDPNLICAARKNGYKIKFVPHELVRQYFKNMKTDDCVEIITENVVYRDIFREGALLVTDYSSTAFDFAYLRKPVLYCQFDIDEIYTAHTYKKGYFDYERDGFGKVLYDQQNLIDEIILSMESGCALLPEYRKKADGFFAYNDKNNCKRIFDCIMNYGKKR